MLTYQNALFKGREHAGERECEARWDLIKDHLPARGMVLDLGSNLGYFGLQTVLAREDVAVVSVECDDAIVDRQKRIIASHGTTRICVIQGVVNSEVSCRWVETCDWFELTLLLSVLHWFDDPGKVVQDLARMSACIIAEVPDAQDQGACGQKHLEEWQDPLGWFRDVTGRECELLGRIRRHTSEQASHVILIRGPVSRRPSLPYWGSQFVHPEGNDYQLSFDGTRLCFSIRHREVDYIPGINLLSLMKLGRLVWPEMDYWFQSGLQELENWRAHWDPLPHNMLWTPHGVKLIDGDDLRGDIRGAAAARAFKKYIRAWRQNKTAGKNAYVPHLPRWRRVSRYWFRKLIRMVLPNFVRAWLQQRGREAQRRI